MLILCRRPMESIHIGDDIVVTVLAVKGNQVRFGISAPRSIAVDRTEIWERKKRSAIRDKSRDIDENIGEKQS